MNKLNTTLILVLLIAVVVYAIQLDISQAERKQERTIQFNEQVIERQASWNVESMIEDATDVGYGQGFALGYFLYMDGGDQDVEGGFREACHYINRDAELRALMDMDIVDSCNRELASQIY